MALTAEAARRLDEIVATHALDGRARDALEALLDVVAADPTAPTTVREPVDAVDAHVADSLAGLEVDAVRDAGLIADLGAGAGFPGLALAAALPTARVALVESVSRKCEFLRRGAASAALTNAEVVCARAEEWRDGVRRCDVVTARALAPLDVLVEYASPLLVPGGSLVAWKGRRDRAEEEAGARAAERIGMAPDGVRRVEPFSHADHRHLHLYSKVRETPAGFPRRPGMARKRPLGASS